MPSLRQFDRGAATDDLVEALRVDGACVALDLVPAEQRQRLLADVLPQLETMRWGEDRYGYGGEFFGATTKRLHGLFACSEVMAEIALLPRVHAVVRAMLCDGGPAREVRISNIELMVLGPGQPVQGLHTDAMSWHHAQQLERDRGDGHGELLVSVNLALTAFSADNGATVVVPGSQRWPSDRVAEDGETTQAVMPAGAGLIYTGNVLHGGGANHSDDIRVGLYIGYVVSWLRPLENHLVTNGPEVVRGLPDALQRLLDVRPSGMTPLA